VCFFSSLLFFFQAEDGIRDFHVTGVQTCALPIWLLLLLRELGYGRVPTTSGSHMTAGADGDVRQYPISHLWADVPIHLMGWGIRSEERRVGKESRSRGTTRR